MKGTPITEEIYQYMVNLFPAEDELLTQLCADAVAKEIPAIQISPEQGAVMQMLLTALNAKRVIEVGTLAGYSSIIMARALPLDGVVNTVEFSPIHAEFATSYAAKAGLANKIKVHVGAGVDVLSGTLANSGPYDFAFIDADKTNHTNYLNLILPMMRDGGIVAGDNALAWGKIADKDTEDLDVRGLQDFNTVMSKHPSIVSSCIIPVGDGMCLGVVKN